MWCLRAWVLKGLMFSEVDVVWLWLVLGAFLRFCRGLSILGSNDPIWHMVPDPDTVSWLHVDDMLLVDRWGRP